MARACATKADQKKLIQTYALKVESARGEAPFKAQQRYHDRFMKTYNRLRDKCPNIDLSSDNFWNSLERRASSWYKSRVGRGPGVDW